MTQLYVVDLVILAIFSGIFLYVKAADDWGFGEYIVAMFFLYVFPGFLTIANIILHFFVHTSSLSIWIPLAFWVFVIFLHCIVRYNHVRIEKKLTRFGAPIIQEEFSKMGQVIESKDIIAYKQKKHVEYKIRMRKCKEMTLKEQTFYLDGVTPSKNKAKKKIQKKLKKYNVDVHFHW